MQRDMTRGVTLPFAPNAARRIPLKSKGHFSGHLIVGNGSGQVMEVESNLEMRVALVLSMRPEVTDLENQTPLRWWCAETRQWRTHYFDFRASLRDGTRTAVIVKPSRKLACEAFRAEVRQIAAQVTERFADRVSLMTERDIDPIELHNATFLDGLKERDPEADAAVRRAMIGVLGARTIGEITAGTGLAGRGFRAVGRLLKTRELALSRRVRITNEAHVHRRAA